MTRVQNIIKRCFDVCLSATGIVLFGWLIFACWLVSSLDTGMNGFFLQQRVGRKGKLFYIIKIRTMRSIDGVTSVVTVRGDPRITRIGALMRKFKLDELPQLFNVFLGQMSFVGPRPDVEAFANSLKGEDRIILSVRPGITGPATLVFSNEEEILAECEDPERYNSEVIFVEKIKINRSYIENYSFIRDVLYIIVTLVPDLRNYVLPEINSMQNV